MYRLYCSCKERLIGFAGQRVSTWLGSVGHRLAGIRSSTNRLMRSIEQTTLYIYSANSIESIRPFVSDVCDGQYSCLVHRLLWANMLLWCVSHRLMNVCLEWARVWNTLYRGSPKRGGCERCDHRIRMLCYLCDQLSGDTDNVFYVEPAQQVHPYDCLRSWRVCCSKCICSGFFVSLNMPLHFIGALNRVDCFLFCCICSNVAISLSCFNHARSQ